MRWQEIRAHRLAETIMVMQAKELAKRHTHIADWGSLYDPLAATCLGILIYQSMTNRALLAARDKREGE